MRGWVWFWTLCSRWAIHRVMNWWSVLLPHELLVTWRRSGWLLLLLHLALINLIWDVSLWGNVFIILLLSASRWILRWVDSLRQKGIDAWPVLNTIWFVRSDVLFLGIDWILVGIIVHTVHCARVLGLLACWSLRVLWFAKDSALKVLESYHDHGDIIQWLAIERVLENGLDCKSRLLMHILSKLLVFVVNWATVPNTLHAIFIWKLVKDAVTSKDDEVMLLSNLELSDVWLANYDIWITSSEVVFCFRIPKCSWNR